jgi:hypothetical protein
MLDNNTEITIIKQTYVRVDCGPLIAMEVLTKSVNLPVISKALVAVEAILFVFFEVVEIKVSKRGDKSARFNTPNRTESKVVMTYGMANFSMGLAKDNKRKYVFIKKN